MPKKGQRTGKTVLCAYCGKPVYLEPGRLKQYKIFFCSFDCKSKGYKFWVVHPKTQFKKGSTPWNKGLTKKDNPRLKGNTIKGRPAWNRGLTKKTDEKVRLLTEKMRLTKLKAHKPSHRKGVTMEQEYGEEKAKQLRKEIRQKRLHQVFPKQSSIEKILGQKLQENNYRFEPQFAYQITQIDIAFPEHKLAIYCDGDYWHANPKFYDKNNLDKIQTVNCSYDKRNNEFLLKNNWTVLRFWGSDILSNVNSCIEKIKEVLNVKE